MPAQHEKPGESHRGGASRREGQRFYDDQELFSAWAKRAHSLVPAKVMKKKKASPKPLARKGAPAKKSVKKAARKRPETKRTSSR